MPEFDVIVVGGGLAGIAATAELTRAGRRVALVEARPRFGGRVFTRHDPLIDYPIELGAEWVDGDGSMHRLLAAEGDPLPTGDGEFLRVVGGKIQDIESGVDGGRELHRRLRNIKGPDRPLAQALAECCDGPELAAAIAMLRSYVEGFHAADPEEISLKWWNVVERSEPASASDVRSRYGLDGGVNALLRTIGSTCTAYLDTVVSGIRWKRGEVLVDCRSGGQRATLVAATAIVTLPAALLALKPGAPGAVAFAPELSGKRRALDLIATGDAVKINVVFDQAFWRELSSLDGALFVQDPSQIVPTWWTMRPEVAPILVGWAAGPRAEPLANLSPGGRLDHAIHSLAHLLGIDAGVVRGHVIAYHSHDWKRDLFSQGAYTWIRAGGVDAHKALAAPLRDTLFFAGEATCGRGRNATMDGAIESGRRAAEEVLALA